MGDNNFPENRGRGSNRRSRRNFRNTSTDPSDRSQYHQYNNDINNGRRGRPRGSFVRGTRTAPAARGGSNDSNFVPRFSEAPQRGRGRNLYSNQSQGQPSCEQNGYSTTEDPSSELLFRQLSISSSSGSKKTEPGEKVVDFSRREKLIMQLQRNSYDCTICCEKVRRQHKIWSCVKCFNIFHLPCVQKWATSSADVQGWRCPVCQSSHDSIPNEYRCFCGSKKNPSCNTYQEIPHSCGNVCGRIGLRPTDCSHPCQSPCHPGPCPVCDIQQSKKCCCGATSAVMKCGSKNLLTCQNTCGKKLNCDLHTCKLNCHSGDCPDCDKLLINKCYCGSTSKEELCSSALVSKDFSCGQKCPKTLLCRNHSCPEICHAGPCPVCVLSPQVVKSCPCGKCAPGPKPRTSCLDPVATCGQICGKLLPCASTEDDKDKRKHSCPRKCHLEPTCGPCEGTSKIKCRCGNKTLQLPCKELKGPEEPYLCEKKCTKKRSCGRHKCNTKCCADRDHICTIVCGKLLKCGLHNCENLCHFGHCRPCGNVSFEDLYCECGATGIAAPIPCGTKPPACKEPCSREHSCDHPVMHTCHSDLTCPPCTFLTEKYCYGMHGKRKNVLCHIQGISCGLPCGKKLPCNQHLCPLACHPNNCLKPNESCKLPCETKRVNCDHKCGAPCHENECPQNKCKETVEVTCKCDRKKESWLCYKWYNEYERNILYEMNKTIVKARETQPDFKNEEFDKDNFLEQLKSTYPKFQVLDCDKECQRQERNRKLAEALEVDDESPSSVTHGVPNYSEFLLNFASKNPQVVEKVHASLLNLVNKAKKSHRKNETFAFESMKREKRHFVHEYSDHFGIMSESFDEEPNRNVICTASKEKSYCPSVSLIDAVFKPPPIRTERKNVYEDVNFVESSKTPIIGPSNRSLNHISYSSAAIVKLGSGTNNSN